MPNGESTFPNDDDLPTKSNERSFRTPIATKVAREFVQPKRPTGRRNGLAFRASVSMPETAVNEDRRSNDRQDDVGRTGQFVTSTTAPKTDRTNDLFDDSFGRGTGRLDRPHHFTSFSTIEDVGHGRPK
jgi:hypothetical protein